MTKCNGRNCCGGQKHLHSQKPASPDNPAGTHQATILRLKGLDCADCAAKLQKNIQQLPGVKGVNLNFAAAKMTVEHAADITKIIKAVDQAGYTAELLDDRPGIYKAAREKENGFHGDNKIDIKTIFTSLSGLFLAAGFLTHILQTPGHVVAGLFLGAMITGGFFIARSAFYALKSLNLDMNVLMIIAASGAAAIGEWGEGATVVFLFSLGNSLQAYSMEKTRRSIRELMELSPPIALVKRNRQEIILPVEEIMIGDHIIVKPGEKIAMDGKIILGTSLVNEAPITGESMPVEKGPDSKVFAGTVNGEGVLEILVTKLVQDSTLARIIHMVEEAQAQRAPSQQFVDMFAKYYTPAVIMTAIAIAILPPLLAGLAFTPWLKKALILLVIACPCALVISTPVSIVSAIGKAAQDGILIKGGAYLEEAGSLKVIAFDKTGTLTRGQPEVSSVTTFHNEDEERVLGIAAAVERRSEHPLARAIDHRARQAGIIPPQSTDFKSFTGQGASAVINGQCYYVGNLHLFEGLKRQNSYDQRALVNLQKKGHTTMLIGTKKKIIGIIAAADRPRVNSASAIGNLKEMGIKKTIMLTGDNEDTAKSIAAELGLDDFRSELMPGDKLLAIRELQSLYGKVAMVGDGINDAPALAAADVGIAMGEAGTDTALETADMVLMAGDLSKLPGAIHLGQRTLRIIKQNISFALFIKAVFIAGTLVGITNLWMAVFADTGASLIVIANGMRLMR